MAKGGIKLNVFVVLTTYQSMMLLKNCVPYDPKRLNLTKMSSQKRERKNLTEEVWCISSDVVAPHIWTQLETKTGRTLYFDPCRENTVQQINIFNIHIDRSFLDQGRIYQ